MRIVLVTHFFPAHGGGVENVAAQIARHMIAQGHQVVWCASHIDPSPSISGLRAVPMRSVQLVERWTGLPYPLWSLDALRLLNQEVKAADAVHVHDCIYMGSLAAAWFARRHHKPWVVTQHIGHRPLPVGLQAILTLAYRLGARWVLDPARGVGFISPAVKRFFEHFSGTSGQFHYVPNGVDTDVFRPASVSQAAARRQLGLSVDRPLMLFVGRFVAVKRLYLVREMARLRPEWQWCVIGEGSEQPDTWGLANVQVLSHMSQDRLAAFYRAADLLVLPSAHEGFPLVVQEAMACGLPACITENVAAGAHIPAALWLQLPECPPDTARQGVEAIGTWLARSATAHEMQRADCVAYAQATWQWTEATRLYLAWLQDGGYA